MKTYEVKGIRSNNDKVGTVQITANSAGEIWGNPKVHGFRKVFNVAGSPRMRRGRTNG